MSVLKTVRKRKISRRLCKNLHIIYNFVTIVNIASLFTFSFYILSHVKTKLKLDRPNPSP